MKLKRLIVNADDFGQSDGVNKGIIYAHQHGILTSASLMVRYPAAKFAADYSKDNTIGIGLHVDLGEWIYSNSDWKPVYEVVSLNDANAVKREVIRQLDIFYRLTGKKPTHIDSHQHVHKRENILPVFLEIARSVNVTLRGFNDEVKYCGDFYGQSSDSSPAHEYISVNNLKQILSKLPDGITEMACHPGMEIDFQTMYRQERKMEVESLCDRSISETIEGMNIELCNFSGITYKYQTEVIPFTFENK